jgi:hypothetical protein
MGAQMVRVVASGNKNRGTMGQFRFFDADRPLSALTAKGDPLEMIGRVVPAAPGLRR